MESVRSGARELPWVDEKEGARLLLRRLCVEDGR